MKVSPHIRVALIVVFSTLLPFLVSAQALFWVGQSGNWNELRNWSTADGKAATHLPSKNTHVYFAAESSGSINMEDEVIEMASLTGLNSAQVTLHASRSVTLVVSGSLNLPTNFSLASPIEIELTGLGYSSPTLSAPAVLESQLHVRSEKYEKIPGSGGTRGSCPFFDLTADPTPPTCNGFDDGIAAVLEPTTGVGPYTYQWIGGPSTREWTNLGAGTYTVIVFDQGQGGVPCNLDVFVNEPGPLTVFSLNPTSPTCANLCNGQAAPIIIGGNGGYSLTWSSGETGATAAALCASFNLSIEDVAGCIADTNVTFDNIPPPILIDEVVTEVTCFGADDGMIDLTASGGTGSLGFSWAGPGGFTSVSEDIAGLEPGSYTVEVTDDNGCTVDETFTIVENPILLVSASSTENECNGDNTGAIDLTIAGGLAPYSVSWTGPAGFTSNSQDIASLAAGTYEVTVTDASNCVVVVQETVNEPLPLGATITPSSLLCFENNSGQLTAAALGGTPGYNYSWSGPNGFFGSGPTIIGLPAGTYSLTVTDNNACVFTTDVDLVQPDELTLDFLDTPISCNGDSDGEIDLTVSGGTPSYTFSWTGPSGFTSTSEDISGLSTGTYTVQVTDLNNCSITEAYFLDEPLPISLSAAVTNPDCAAENTGVIDLTIANGTPPYNVLWSGPSGFSSADEDIANLEVGTYTVVVTDAGSCFETDTYTITQPTGLDADFSLSPVSCFEGNDGAIGTVPAGGVPPYSFNWSGPGAFSSTSQSLSGLSSGTYTLVLGDDNGCEETFTETIIQPTDIDVLNTTNDVSCFGGSDGFIEIVASGATPPYSYLWSGPSGFSSIDQDIAGLTAGDYDLELTDGNGCVFNFLYTVGEPDEILLAATITDVLCAGDLTGEIDLTVTGGTPSFDFSWSGPSGFNATTENLVGLAAGNYTVVVSDGEGCTATGSYSVVEEFDVSATINQTNISCFGAGDGDIDLTAAGGVEPYAFTWSGPDGFTSSNEDISGLVPGQYTVLIVDGNGCQESTQVGITEPDEIVLNLASNNIDCFGANDGLISVTTSGGTNPLNFSWSGPNGFSSSDQNISGLEPGNYEVTVSDANGCSASGVVEITENAELIVTVETFDSNCLQSDGLAVATASGGTGELTFAWENESGIEIALNDSLIDVPGGTYEVIVTDELSCSVGVIAVISDSNGVLTGTVTNPTCSGDNDGAIATNLSGGTAPFIYEWTDGNGFSSSLDNISDLEAGTYILSITDAANCLFTESFEVEDPLAIVVNANIEEVSCVGTDGSISLTTENASGPITVAWTGPNGYSGSGTSISNLELGDYDYGLTDSVGCSSTGTVALTGVSPIGIVETVTHVNCAGDGNGQVELETTGGLPPLVFAWTGPDGFVSNNEDIFGLAPGDYSLVVTDQSTCSESLMLTITEPDSILVDIAVSEPDCNQSNGSLEATITGGNVSGSYGIVWTDESGNAVSNVTLVENLASGNYNLIVTDDNGCTYSEDFTLSNPGGDITTSITPETCGGGLDGAINLEIANVAEPFTIAWVGPNGFTSSDEDIDNLAGGTYTFTISGADGCVFTEALEVSSPEAIDVVTTISNTCFGESSGQIEIEITGGEAPYAVSWMGPNSFASSNLSIADLAAGTYQLLVTDNAGCDFLETYTIDENPEIVSEIILQNVSCFGETDGSVDLTVSGGLPPYTVNWLGPDGFSSANEDLTMLTNGEYTLTITDANNCSAQNTVLVSQPDELIVVEEITATGCSDLPNSGAITLFPEGGQPGYTVSWTGPDGFTADLLEIVDLVAGTYDYTLTDLGGCVAENTIEIVDVVPLTLDVNTVEPDCFGASTGAIEITVSGGTGVYQTAWTGPNGFVASADIIDNLGGGDYSLTLTDEAGCVLQETVTLVQPVALVVVLNTVAASCVNVADGSIESEASGGTIAYSYAWSGPEGYSDADAAIASLLPGEYVLTLTDANGCQVSDTTTVESLFDLDVSAGADTALCPSALEVVLIGSVSGGDEYYWTLDGDTISVGAEVTIDETYEGITDLVFIGSNGLCSESDTLAVEILESPEVDAGEDMRVFIEEVFTLGGSPTSTDGTTFLWTPNPLSVFDSSLANPRGFLLESAEFVVLVTDLNGCQSADTVFVEVLPDIVVTSGFTPNGDGANDVWIIDNIELFPSMVVHVFNRWGMEVFESQGYNANVAWDGTYGGSLLPSGTYYYTIELNDSRFPDPITGPLTLHR